MYLLFPCFWDDGVSNRELSLESDNKRNIMVEFIDEVMAPNSTLANVGVK